MTKVTQSKASTSLESQYLTKLYAKYKVGLFNPSSITHSLKIIIKEYNIHSWGNSQNPYYKICYYLGYAIMTHLYKDTDYISKPFLGINKIKLPAILLNKPIDILRFGCASETSHLHEKQTLTSLGIKIRSHTTLDLSNIPIQRCKLTDNDKRFSFIQGDASRMKFKSESIHLATTDLLLGSMNRDREKFILNDVRRVLIQNGFLLMKVFCGTDIEKPSANSGLIWRDIAISKYGEKNKRDNYIHLTKNQWNAIGTYYNKFIYSTYYTRFKYKNLKQIETTLHNVGFKIVKSKKIDSKTTDSIKGYFAILAKKV